jgi:hypothetical protein
MSNNIDQATIQFHNGNDDLVTLLNFPEQHRFGLLNVKVSTIPIRKEKQLISFSVDISGSMDDPCSDGNSKLHHCRETLKNMIQYFGTIEEKNVYIQVDVFDDKGETVIPAVCVSQENVSELIETVNNINHRGQTNIELALNRAVETIGKYRVENPGVKVTHIFMTDGDATVGMKINSALANLINDQYANIFVGMGSNHNATMLQLFSEKLKAEYRFIDSGEKTGLVYGEILHRLLYNAIDEVVVSANGGEIYDWKTDSWKTSIVEDVFDSGIEKIYQIRSTQPSSMTVDIIGKLTQDGSVELLENVESLPDLEDVETGEIFPVDLTKYIFRQRTQSLLYSCRKLSVNHGSDYDNLKTKMKDLFREMRVYIRTNNLNTDSFMLVLCEDISTSYRNLGTESGRMYSGARQTSQGRQDTFTPRYEAPRRYEAPPAPMRHPRMQRQNALATQIEFDDLPTPPRATRTPSRSLFSQETDVDNWNEPEEEHKEEVVSEDPDDLEYYVYGNQQQQTQVEIASAYSTPGRLQLMRTATGPMRSTGSPPIPEMVEL